MFFRNTLYYFVVTTSISLWWLLAFQNPIANENSFSSIPKKEKTFNFSELDFLRLNRHEIKEALEGNWELMSDLISQWEVASEYLEQKGISYLKRLNREDFVFSQLINRRLKKGDIPQERQSILIDKVGQPIDLTSSFKRIYPQTYHSAEILLALSDINKIVALSEGFKKQGFIQSNEKTKLVPFDLSFWNIDKIYEAHPEIAIVAEYSHPSLLQILKKQGVQLYFQKPIEKLTDLENSIIDMGLLCEEPLKAHLLNIFIKAVLNAIDNKREIYLKDFDYDKVLILQYYSKHSLPLEHSLMNDFIKRIGFHKTISQEKRSDNTKTPFSEEEIINFNPQYLLIVTEKNEGKLNYFYRKKYASHIDAAMNRKIFLLDEEVQQTSSQFAVLAYYDLNQCLVNLDDSN